MDNKKVHPTSNVKVDPIITPLIHGVKGGTKSIIKVIITTFIFPKNCLTEVIGSTVGELIAAPVKTKMQGKGITTTDIVMSTVSSGTTRNLVNSLLNFGGNKLFSSDPDLWVAGSIVELVIGFEKECLNAVITDRSKNKIISTTKTIQLPKTKIKKYSLTNLKQLLYENSNNILSLEFEISNPLSIILCPAEAKADEWIYQKDLSTIFEFTQPLKSLNISDFTLEGYGSLQILPSHFLSTAESDVRFDLVPNPNSLTRYRMVTWICDDTNTREDPSVDAKPVLDEIPAKKCNIYRPFILLWDTNTSQLASPDKFPPDPKHEDKGVRLGL